jgi:hypothetical protein
MPLEDQVHRVGECAWPTTQITTISAIIIVVVTNNARVRTDEAVLRRTDV